MPTHYAKFNRAEATVVLDKAEAAYIKRYLKARPTYRSQYRVTPGGIRWTGLTLIAAVLFLLVCLFSGQKASLHAVPVANAMYDALITGEDGKPLELFSSILTPTRQTFVDTMRLMFIAMSELGIVYFALLAVKTAKAGGLITWRGSYSATAGYVLAELADTQRILSLLPRLIFFGLIGYIVFISSAGGDRISLFDRFLPVLVGIGLTLFIEELFKKQSEHVAAVELALIEAQSIWDANKAAMPIDERYLMLVHDFIGEALLTITRQHPVTKKRYQPNAALESAEDYESIILAEYKRITANVQFAKQVRATLAENQAEREDYGELRTPPNGATEWTPETLWSDLMAINAPKPLQRAFIRKHYATGLKAETMFSAIVDKWNG